MSIQSITIYGRRWIRRGFGNTYCTAEVYINGKLAFRTPEQYGYDDHYITIARDALVSSGVLAIPEGKPLWSYCRDNGIELVTSVADVSREKDL